MSTTKFRGIRFLVPVLLILLGGGYYFGFIRNRNEHADQVWLQPKAIQAGNGWGYDILANGKVYIHQEFIPAIPGKLRFSTEADALKVGRRVVDKMSSSQLPSISIEDLKELGIAYDSIAAK